MNQTLKQNFFLPLMNDHHFLCLPESVGRFGHWPQHHVHRLAGSLKEFNLHFITEGKGFVEIGGITYSMQKGDAFLYFPQDKNYYYSDEDEPWDIRWVHFYGPMMRSFLIEHGFHRSSLWSVKRPDSLAELHQQLMEEVRHYSLLNLPRLSMLTYGVIAHFMNDAVPHTYNKGFNREEKVAALLPLMQKEASRPFLLEEWAQQANVTPYYFCKLFRKVTHMSPLDFITMCRLQQAKQLLLEDPYRPVKEIAHRVGYPTASYFNKRFMTHEGMTPTEFRTLHSHGS